MSFNKIKKLDEKKIEREHKERMARVVPVAKKLIKLIAENIDDVELGDVEVTHESLIDLTKKCMTLMLEESKSGSFKVSDRNLLFQIALQAISVPQQHAQTSLDRGINETMTAVIGKPYNELEMSELDEFMKKAEKIEADFAKKK